MSVSCACGPQKNTGSSQRKHFQSTLGFLNIQYFKIYGSSWDNSLGQLIESRQLVILGFAHLPVKYLEILNLMHI